MNKRAFTLIELSIVLIIIGLIIGGILAGQSLIAQARVRGLISDINNMQISLNTFNLKYAFLPGDFPNASTMLSNANCTSGTTPSGCSGNGNWQIEWGAYVDGDEIFRFAQHLSLAGLINGNFTGTRALSDKIQSKYSNNTYVGARYTKPYTNTSSFDNMLEIGGNSTTYFIPSAGSINPIDAYGVDSKMDDGKANSGQIYGIDGDNITTSEACSYPHSSTTGKAEYNLAGTQGPYCRLQVRIN